MSWIAPARAWPEEQQDYCICGTMARILCLALVHQLRETLTSWRWPKEGHQYGHSAAEPGPSKG